MTLFKNNFRLPLSGIGILMSLCFVPGALAAETSAGWRSTYDVVMLWVNFGILIFLIFKILRTPMKDFFRGRRMEMEKELKRAEEADKDVAARIRAAINALDESGVRFEKVKERIVRQGEEKKEQIIKDARAQGQLMIEDARQKMVGQLRSARNRFKSELIDSAIALALEELPGKFTEEDNQKYITLFMEKAASDS